MQNKETHVPGAQPVRILIVDDEAAQMKALCDTLRDYGYETAGFATGAAALAALREVKFELLLADLMMPGMDGIALLQAALETDADLVGIIMTGAGSIASTVEAMKVGAFDYILKPFKVSVILPALSRALAMRQLRVRNAELEQLKQKNQRELMQAAGALQQSEATLRIIADSLPALIAEVDTREIFRFANRAYEEWFELPRDQIIGHPVRGLIGETAYAEVKPYVDLVLKGEAVELEREMVHNGRSRHLRLNYTPLLSIEGTVKGYLVLGTDVSGQKALEFQLRHTAEHDALTGVPNRVLFQDRLQQALKRARRDNRSLAVLYLDVDKFKTINDSYGHSVGDELLTGFADRIRQCVRATDTVARRGGDEFVVLLEGLTTAGDATSIAEKIINAMHVPFHLQDQSVRATTSVGIAIASGGNIDGESLVARADAALYRAKGKGRDTFHIEIEPAHALAQDFRPAES